MQAETRWALAQLNLWVGDVAGNVDKIIQAAVEARDRHGARLLLCPELALLGYPPQELVGLEVDALGVSGGAGQGDAADGLGEQAADGVGH